MTKITEIQDRSAASAWSPIREYADVIAIGAKVSLRARERERDCEREDERERSLSVGGRWSVHHSTKEGMSWERTSHISHLTFDISICIRTRAALALKRRAAPWSSTICNSDWPPRPSCWARSKRKVGLLLWHGLPREVLSACSRVVWKTAPSTFGIHKKL